MPQSWRRVTSLTALVLVVALFGFAAGVAAVDGTSQAKADETKAGQGENQKAPSKAAKAKLKRVGSVVGLNEETMEQYILLHEHVWPEVLKRIRESNCRNYSIFVGQLDDGQYYLFSYFEYVGDDFDADMAAMAADPVTRDWWKLTAPLQRRVQGTPVGDQWKILKQVFHTD